MNPSVGSKRIRQFVGGRTPWSTARVLTSLVLVLALRSAVIAGAPAAGLSESVLRGAVRDDQGKPIRRVKIRLIRFRDAAVFLSESVGPRGEYEIRGLTEGRFAVQVVWNESGDVYPWVAGVMLGGGQVRWHPINVESFPSEPRGDAWVKWQKIRARRNALPVWGDQVLNSARPPDEEVEE